jgi:broad specificity phosphatase PhoE
MSLRLYLLRHGETTCSRSGIFCGALDPELTAEGALMAEDFAATYRTLPWEALYVSPMRRTIATAKPLCAAAGLSMELRDGLKELAYGEWEGRTAEDARGSFADDYVRWLAEPSWNAPTGGETGAHVAGRASSVVEEILNRHRDGNVLVVSHKATVRLILCSLLGIDLGRYRDRLDAPAASVSVVRFGEHGPMLERLGDRSHMRAELRALPGT